MSRMPQTPTHTILGPEDMADFEAALDRPAAPTEAAIRSARLYRDKIADGTLVVVDDAEETADWARKSFAALGFDTPAAPSEEDTE